MDCGLDVSSLNPPPRFVPHILSILVNYLRADAASLRTTLIRFIVFARMQRREIGQVLMHLTKNFKLVPAAVGLMLAATACATHNGGTKTPEADAARELFQRNCAACHGHDGEGRQIGTLKAPSLREGRPLTDTDEHLLKQIHDGGNGMPPFKYSLTDEQIADLLRFVRELQERGASKQ